MRASFLCFSVMALVFTGTAAQGQGGQPVGFTRYFAEGAVGFFRTDIGLANTSGTETATVVLTYLTETGARLSQHVELAPMQRRTISVNDFLAGFGGGVSTIVESNIPIAADRFMEWGANGYGSSLSGGATAPSQTWYFAEGATSIFSLYYLLLNPADTPADVTITYLLELGSPVTRRYSVPPHSRYTLSVHDDPALRYVSAGAVISSDVPIVAERAMYLSSPDEVFTAGSAGIGAPQLATQWSFAEGAPGGLFDEFLLIANPATTPTTATITYRRPDGVSAAATYTVPAQGRATVWVNQEMATNHALAPVANSPISTLIAAPQPIVAERTMWWDRGARGGWYENATSLGATQPATAWTVAEGSVGGPRHEQTFVLIANTAPAAGQVQLTVMTDSGNTSTQTQTQTLPIPPFGRLSVEIGPTFSIADTHFSAVVESVGSSPVPLVVEYSRYGSGDSRTWAAGGSTLATPRATAPPPPRVEPNAVDDVYSETVLGNVPVVSSIIGYRVTSNDTLGQARITAYDAVSVHGGTVSMTMSGPDAGTFTFNPPRGYTGPDSFTYSISDGVTTDTAMVTLNIAGRAWFIRAGASCGASCDGRLLTPYASSSAFQGINDGVGSNPRDGDTIFLFEGANHYTGPLTLRRAQRLFGQDAAASSFATLTGLAVPASSLALLPTPNSTNAETVQFDTTLGSLVLNADNVVRGLIVNTVNSGSTGIRGTAGGTFTASDISVQGVGRTLDLANYALDATFRSLNSVGGSVSSGLGLRNTTGRFVVTGDGSTPGSGGTLSTQSFGVSLSNTEGVSLAFMIIQGNLNDGIRVMNANGLTLDHVIVRDNLAAAGVNALDATNLSGTVTIRDSTLTSRGDTAVSIANSIGTPLSFTVTNSTFANTVATSVSGGHAFSVSAAASADMAINVNGSAFTGSRGQQFQAMATGAATLHVTLRNNTFTGGNAASIGQGIAFGTDAAFSGTMTYDLTNNVINGAVGTAISAAMNGSMPGSSLSGTIIGNTLGNAGADSGSSAGNGIDLKITGSGTHSARVESNAIGNIARFGIVVIPNNGDGALNLNVFDNTFTNFNGPLSAQAFYLDAGVNATDTTQVCVALGSGTQPNTLTHGSATLRDLTVMQEQNVVVHLPGYAGGLGDNSAVEAFLNGQNNGASGLAVSNVGGGGGFAGGPACSTP